MPYDEYGFSMGMGTCPHCGAGLNSHNEHQADCLINIPGRHSELSAYWHLGHSDHKRLGGKPDDEKTAGMTQPQYEAYFMGMRLADAKARAAPAKAA